jgi:hypothetical protein
MLQKTTKIDKKDSILDVEDKKMVTVTGFSSSSLDVEDFAEDDPDADNDTHNVNKKSKAKEADRKNCLKNRPTLTFWLPIIGIVCACMFLCGGGAAFLYNQLADKPESTQSVLLWRSKLIDFDDCCGSDKKQEAFLKACTESLEKHTEDIECYKVTKGSTVIWTKSGKTEEEHKKHVDKAFKGTQSILNHNLDDIEFFSKHYDNQLNEKEVEINRQKVELQQKVQEIAVKDQEIASKDQELVQKVQEIASKDQEIAQKESDLITQTQENLITMAKVKAEFEKKIDEKIAALRKIGQAKKDLKKDLESKLTKMTYRNTVLEHERNDRLNKLNQAENKIEELRNNQKQIKITNLQKMIEEKDQKIAKQEKTISNITTKLKTTATLEKNNKDLQTQNTNLQEKIYTTAIEQKKLSENHEAALKQKNRKQQRELVDLNHRHGIELNLAKDQYKEISTILQNKDEHIKKLSADLESENTKLIKKKNEITKKDWEIKENNKEIAKNNEEIEKKNQDIEKKDKKIEELNMVLKEGRVMYDNLKTDAKNKQDALLKLNFALKQKNAKTNKLEKLLKRKNILNAKANEPIAELISEKTTEESNNEEKNIQNPVINEEIKTTIVESAEGNQKEIKQKMKEVLKIKHKTQICKKKFTQLQ